MSRNPFEEIERAFERMSEQFEQVDRVGPGAFVGGIRVDVEDRAEEYVVHADLPGFDREEIEVELSEQTLSLSADSERETEVRDETYLRRERRRTGARRSIHLPEPVVGGETRATYENGVLTVTLPKRTPGNQGTDIPVN